MKIEDIDPSWDGKEIVRRMIEELDTEDLILYLSGLDDEALKRIEDRKKMINWMKEYDKMMSNFKGVSNVEVFKV